MLPSKTHLQIIVRELERFGTKTDEGFNFNSFFDRCRAIFKPAVQKELFEKLKEFQEQHYINTITAEHIIIKHRVEHRGGTTVLRLQYPDGRRERKPLNVASCESHLRDIVVWCRKQIIRMVKDEQIDFDKMPDIDYKQAKK